VRLLSEKVGDQPESHCDKEKKVEFSVPTWQVIVIEVEVFNVLMVELSHPTWQVDQNF